MSLETHVKNLTSAVEKLTEAVLKNGSRTEISMGPDPALAVVDKLRENVLNSVKTSPAPEPGREPAPEPGREPAPEPAKAAKTAKEITKLDAAAALVALGTITQSHEKPAAVLEQFGVARVSELKPENFRDVVNEAFKASGATSAEFKAAIQAAAKNVAGKVK